MRTFLFKIIGLTGLIASNTQSSTNQHSTDNKDVKRLPIVIALENHADYITYKAFKDMVPMLEELNYDIFAQEIDQTQPDNFICEHFKESVYNIERCIEENLKKELQNLEKTPMLACYDPRKSISHTADCIAVSYSNRINEYKDSGSDNDFYQLHWVEFNFANSIIRCSKGYLTRYSSQRIYTELCQTLPLSIKMVNIDHNSNNMEERDKTMAHNLMRLYGEGHNIFFQVGQSHVVGIFKWLEKFDFLDHVVFFDFTSVVSKTSKDPVLSQKQTCVDPNGKSQLFDFMRLMDRQINSIFLDDKDNAPELKYIKEKILSNVVEFPKGSRRKLRD